MKRLLLFFSVIPINTATAQSCLSANGGPLSCTCDVFRGAKGLCQPYCAVFNCPTVIGNNGMECNDIDRVCNICQNLFNAFESSMQAEISQIFCN